MVEDSDTIDMISIDQKNGTVRLHALVQGDWSNHDEKMAAILRKMNVYMFFIKSGQLAADPRYRDRSVKILLNVEQKPPRLALIGFARMKQHLEGQGISCGVTIGLDVTEVLLPSPREQ